MKKVGLLVAIMIVCVAVTACGCQNNSEDKAASNVTRENASQAGETPVFDKFPQPTEANTPYYLYMSVGDKDPWNIDCMLYYRDVLGQMGVKNQTDYVKGYGHDEPFWEQCFYNFLNKIFR